MIKLDQKRLKEILLYDEDTGVFTRKITLNYNSIENTTAGYKDKDGYLVAKIEGVKYRLHRLVFLYMTGSIPSKVDHIDHNRQNNRWSNLQESSDTGNQRNRSLSKNNKSGFNGVSWCNKNNKWIAQISINNKAIHLGRYKNLSDAVLARVNADEKYSFHINHGN